MVQCEYTIELQVLRVPDEVEKSVEKIVKVNLWHLKLVYSQKGIEHQEPNKDQVLMR